MAYDPWLPSWSKGRTFFTLTLKTIQNDYVPRHGLLENPVCR